MFFKVEKIKTCVLIFGVFLFLGFLNIFGFLEPVSSNTQRCGTFNGTTFHSSQNFWPANGTFCSRGEVKAWNNKEGIWVSHPNPWQTLNFPSRGQEVRWRCYEGQNYSVCSASRDLQQDNCGTFMVRTIFNINNVSSWPSGHYFCSAQAEPLKPKADGTFEKVAGWRPVFPKSDGEVAVWGCPGESGDSTCSVVGLDLATCLNFWGKAAVCGNLARGFDNPYSYEQKNWPLGDFCYPDDSGLITGDDSLIPKYPAPREAVRWWCSISASILGLEAELREDLRKIYCPAENPPGLVCKNKIDSDIANMRAATDLHRVACVATRADSNAKCAIPYHTSVFSAEQNSWPSGTSLDKFCERGSLVGSVPKYPKIGEEVRWECKELGVVGETGVDRCWAKRDMPVGDARCAIPYHTSVFSADQNSWPDGTSLDRFCERGELKNTVPSFPEIGTTVEWKCVEHSSEVDCWAERTERPPELAYDIVRGFFVVDGEVNIEFGDKDREIRDGLKVVGGIFSTGGNPSFRLRRSLQLKDNLLYPTVVIFHDARYMDIARRVFGNTFGTGEIRDIGLKE
jgi:hypothetical protein